MSFFRSNAMENQLMELQERALKDAKLCEELLKTREDRYPVRAFCDKCRDLGYDKITVGELISAGDEFCSAMLRSVNGGGVEAPDGWNDFYEMFFDAIERK